MKQKKKRDLENNTWKAVQRNNGTIRAWFVLGFFVFFFSFLNGLFFFFQRETNEKTEKRKKKNRLVPKNPERPAQLNKVAPKHYGYRDKRFAWD